MRFIVVVLIAARFTSGEVSPQPAAGPVSVTIPDAASVIDKLERQYLKTDDPLVAEQLGALLILTGRREAGLRLIGSQAVPPLSLDALSSGSSPPERLGERSGQSAPSGVPGDLAALGSQFAKSREVNAKAVGVFLLVMADKPALAEQALKELPDTLVIRRWLSALLFARTGQADKASTEARSWADDVDRSSPLSLAHLTFVDPAFQVSYGVYQELPARTLSPGELALMYVEVQGARLFQDGSGFSVRFKVDYSVQEDTGKTVWKKDKPDIVSHTTRVPTRDLFITSAFYVPVVLTGGQYSFRLEVEDLISGTKALAAVPFSVRER